MKQPAIFRESQRREEDESVESAQAKYLRSALTAEQADQYSAQLRTEMEDNELFLQSDLRLSDVAGRLAFPPITYHRY